MEKKVMLDIKKEVRDVIENEVREMETRKYPTEKDISNIYRKSIREIIKEEMREMAEKINVKIALLNDIAKVPTQQTSGSAGYDLYSANVETIKIYPGDTVMIPLGFKTEFSALYVALIYARSGLAIKQGLAPANKVGVVDSDYRGEWKVGLYNQSNEVREIEPGTRIAQVVFTPCSCVKFDECREEDLNDTDRGAGGFNSTGTK